ncbi:protein-disulfide isomerase, partial [Salmonella enterica subsp. enterica serovar Montevideo]|nr:protein-disulfide isomerase [Salmonella enterica subsp. enterica serovar Montevideo]
MTEQSTKSLRLGVVAAILLGLVGTGFGIYQFVKEKDLAQEIANVKSTVNQVKDAEGVTFKSKAEFEAAVAESINKFVAQKQQAD